MNYIKKECSVHLVTSEDKTNIRRFVEDGRTFLQYFGLKQNGGESVVVEFRDGENILATSDSEDNYPQIGFDFMWTYLTNFEKIKSVYLYLDKEKIKLKSNGDIQVNACDEKEYTEKDVITMLSYAVAHDKVTAKEMKEKVADILNWFKK